MSTETTPKPTTVTLDEPVVTSTEVRGVRPGDEGNVLYLWTVSVQLNAGWRHGSYDRNVILDIVDEGHHDDRGQHRYRVTLARIRQDGTYRRVDNPKGTIRNSTMWILADGEQIGTCDTFDKPLYMVGTVR